MAKYSIVELAVSNGNLVGVDQLSNNQKRALELNNAIYIYRGTRSKKVYIGQTMHFIERHKQHYNGMEEKFSTADFNKVIVIFSVYFNRSAMDTLEELRTKELVKYSPIKQLTPEQGQLITEIIHDPDRNYVINGDAGTGKTVLLTHLVASILKERPEAKVGVVVQPNWEKTGENIWNE